jgi:hypothetical protein
VRLNPCSSNQHGSRHTLPHLAEYKLNPFRSNIGVSEVLLQLCSGSCEILLESEAGQSLVTTRVISMVSIGTTFKSTEN